MGEFVKCDISSNELFLDLQANVNIFFFVIKFYRIKRKILFKIENFIFTHETNIRLQKEKL